MVESKESAEAYLREKNIGQIFAELGTSLLYHKPADPRAHLIQELEKMKRGAKVCVCACAAGALGRLPLTCEDPLLASPDGLSVRLRALHSRLSSATMTCVVRAGVLLTLLHRSPYVCRCVRTAYSDVQDHGSHEQGHHHRRPDAHRCVTLA